MMQKILADWFNLVIHRDRKTFSVYGLTVGKAGPPRAGLVGTPSKDGQRFLMNVPGEGVATQPPITQWC